MSRTAKVLLSILGCCILLVAGVAGFGYYWFKQHGKEYIEEAKAAYDEGARMGRRTDEPGCYSHALSVLKTPDGNTFSGSIHTSLVFNACLRASKPVATFCDGVPRETDFVAAGTWEAKACAAAGIDGSYCPTMHAEIMRYCVSPQRQAKLARINRGAGAGRDSPDSPK